MRKSELIPNRRFYRLAASLLVVLWMVSPGWVNALPNGEGDFNVAPGAVVTSARDIDVTAVNINANESSFDEARDLFLNGNRVGEDSASPNTTGEVPPSDDEPPGQGEPTLESNGIENAVEQATLETFLTEFFENGGPGGC